MYVDVLNGKFAVKCSFFENDRMLGMPVRKFRKAFAMWACDPCYDNAMHIKNTFDKSEVSDEAIDLMWGIINSVKPLVVSESMPEVILGGARDHQVAALRKAWPEEGFAVLHRPRLGKTFTTIRLACGRYLAGQIKKMVVICPTSIKDVWPEQFRLWGVATYTAHTLEAGKEKHYKKWMDSDAQGLKVLVVGVEGMSTANTVRIVNEFIDAVEGERVSAMVVLDESTRIKNHKSLRTKAVQDIGDSVKFRVILTGSELTRGPEDIFSQFRFLGTHVLGFDSFYAWRNRYVMMGGFDKKKAIGMKNAAELMEKIVRYSHLVKTTDVVDITEKVFSVRTVKPSADQLRMARELRKTMETSLDGAPVTIKIALTLVMRVQQICGGFATIQNEEEETVSVVPLPTNPKLDELMAILDEEPGKVIIFCRFRPEIEAVRAAIAKKYGDETVVEFHGGTSTADRSAARESFQTDDALRYFVANTQTASMGIELSAASLIVYFSNDFNYESRVQSLERATNLTKLTGVGVVDIVVDLKEDKMLLLANDAKLDMAQYLETAIQNGQKVFSED